MSDSAGEKFTDEDAVHAVFRIKEPRPGTCFLVKDGCHLLTARHVVFNGNEAAKEIKVQVGEENLSAQVSQDFKELDVALLRLNQEIKAKPFVLARKIPHDKFKTAGYPVDVPGFWHAGDINGPVNDKPGAYQLTFNVKYQVQLKGLSGAPLLDEENRVAGIITNHYVYESSFGEAAATTSFSHLLDFETIPDNAIRCFVVLSESEGKSGTTLRAAVNEGINLAKKQIAKEAVEEYQKSGKTIIPIFSHATELVADKEMYTKAIRNLCRSEIAVFDATGYEPAVMLLLGIRSVVRRGITIASIGEGGNLDAAPFNIKEVNFISHADTSEVKKPPPPAHILIRDRILKGLEQRRSIQYLDLPAFDAVRRLPLDERNEVRAENNLLVMCSYGAEYEKNNWDKLTIGIGYAALSSFGLSEAPGISRVRDVNLKSPRLVSQMIYESIRRMTMCIIDWTEWSPNVFFEMGVRLSVSDSGTICIIEDRYQKAIEKIVASQEMNDENALHDELELKTRFEPKQMQRIARQCLNLIKLLSPIRYKPADENKAPYEMMVERYEKSLDYKDEDKTLIAHTFSVISEVIDVKAEEIATPVHRKLLQEAELLRSDESAGKSAMLYTKNEGLLNAFEEGITERLLAAWFYLRRRYSLEEIRRNAELKDDFLTIGQRLGRRVKDTKPALAQNIFKVVSKIKAGGDDEKSS